MGLTVEYLRNDLSKHRFEIFAQLGQVTNKRHFINMHKRAYKISLLKVALSSHTSGGSNSKEEPRSLEGGGQQLIGVNQQQTVVQTVDFHLDHLGIAADWERVRGEGEIDTEVEGIDEDDGDKMIGVKVREGQEEMKSDRAPRGRPCLQGSSSSDISIDEAAGRLGTSVVLDGWLIGWLGGCLVEK